MCRPGTNLLEKGKEDDTVSGSPPSTTTSTSLPAGTVVALNTTACSLHVRADSGSKSTRTVLLCSGEDSLFLYTVFPSFWAIPSGMLPLIRIYSYTEGLYMGNKYYVYDGHLSRVARLVQRVA
jgi:hypothetical protein